MRNKATKENMNLDLRRYGRNMYTKAKEESSSSDDATPSGEVTFGQAIKEAFGLNYKMSKNASGLYFTEDTVPFPDLAMCTNNGLQSLENIFDTTKQVVNEGITIPNNAGYNRNILTYTENTDRSKCVIVPFDELERSDVLAGFSGDATSIIYPLYSIDKLSTDFYYNIPYITYACTPKLHLNVFNVIFIIEYEGKYYFTNAFYED